MNDIVALPSAVACTPATLLFSIPLTASESRPPLDPFAAFFFTGSSQARINALSFSSLIEGAFAWPNRLLLTTCVDPEPPEVLKARSCTQR